MSSANLQGTISIYTNQFYFYTVTMNKQNSSIYSSIGKNKIFGTNITKVQNLYSENYRTLLKKKT